MLLRLLSLITLLGMAAPSAGQTEDDDEEEYGGAKFGKITMAFTVIATLVILGVFVLTLISVFSDQFLNTYIDPEV